MGREHLPPPTMHTVRAPWPSTQRLVAGTSGWCWCRRLGPAACGRPWGTSLPLCRCQPAPCWNPRLPWQAFRQGCWSLQAMNGSHMEYFPHRITISIVAAFCSFFTFNILPLHPPVLYPNQSPRGPPALYCPLVLLKVTSVPICARDGDWGF